MSILRPVALASLQANARVAVFLSILFATGCGGPPQPDKPAADSYHNLTTINGAYMRATQKLGRPPTREADLIPFLQEAGDPESILRSPHDGEPYVIVWGIDIRRSSEKGGAPVVAYEKAGKDGKRWVSRGRMILLLSDEDFQKLPLSPSKS